MQYTPTSITPSIQCDSPSIATKPTANTEIVTAATSNGEAGVWSGNSELSKFATEGAGLDLGEDQVRTSRRGYYGAVTFVDEQIGRIVAAAARFRQATEMLQRSSFARSRKVMQVKAVR